MKIKEKLKINITPNYDNIYHEKGSEYGKITIDNFEEHFYMSPQVWTMEQYQQQWKLALERIKTHDTSCFVTNYQLSNRLIVMWTMYKNNTTKTLHIYNNMIVEDRYNKLIGHVKVTPDNIFQFISPQINAQAKITSEEESEENLTEIERRFLNATPSEWVISYED